MNYYNITNKISRLVEETHEWSSTILLPDGDECIDIFSTEMGTASVTLVNAAKQPDVYPKGKAASVYCFDPDIYDENSWMQLKSTLTQVGCVSGCRLVLRYTDQRQTLHRKAFYKLWCSHRSSFQNNGSSNYLSNNVGPCNVVTEHLKFVKTFGALNSLTTKSVLAGEKLLLFGTYLLNFYVGIVHYILCETKTWRAKIYLPTQRTNW
jgi:hypothetical protein